MGIINTFHADPVYLVQYLAKVPFSVDPDALHTGHDLTP